jgi:hypothetical protein
MVIHLIAPAAPPVGEARSVRTEVADGSVWADVWESHDGSASLRATVRLRDADPRLRFVCADVDGDGRLDVVASRAAAKSCRCGAAPTKASPASSERQGWTSGTASGAGVRCAGGATGPGSVADGSGGGSAESGGSVDTGAASSPGCGCGCSDGASRFAKTERSCRLTPPGELGLR